MSMLFRDPISRRPFAEAAGDPAAPGGGASPNPADQPADTRTFSQADLDRIVQQRVGKLNDELRTLREATKEIDALKQRAAEADAAAAKAAEEAELKGKSELEKIQIQFNKADAARKQIESDFAAKLKAKDDEIKARDTALADKTKRFSVMPAIASGAADGAAATALREFLGSAEIELDEAGDEISAITYEGKRYEKVADAVKAFYERAPFLAKPPLGGSGSPRSVPGAVRGKSLADLTPEQALAGMFGG